MVGRDSSVGIATGYELDSLGIKYRCGARFSAHVQAGHGAQTASCTMGIGFLSWVLSGRGLAMTSHPHLDLYLYSPSRLRGLF